MDSPFFRNYYYAPPSSAFPRSYYRAAPRSVPVDAPVPQQAVPARPQREAVSQPGPKVVSIPIRFVGSEKWRDVAAVRIQKVFRGFLVRRAMRKIWKIGREVGEVERLIEGEGLADLIRRDEKERLRVNEMLMGLLFRLDSVTGVDRAVRDCRKKVIRRVVALQEKVDALASRVEEAMEEQSPFTKPIEAAEAEFPDRTPEVVDAAIPDIVYTADDQVVQSSDSAEEGQVLEDFEHPDPAGDVAITPEVSGSADHCVLESSGSAGDSTDDKADKAATQLVNIAVSSEDICGSNSEALVDPIEEARENDQSSVEEVSRDARVIDTADAPEMDGHAHVQETVRDQVGDFKGVMERMVEENQKLQRLVSELCERNLMQNRLMNNLSHRVEQLEKVVARKSRKKKKLGSPSNACAKRCYDL